MTVAPVDIVFRGAWMVFAGALFGAPAALVVRAIARRLFGVPLAFRRAWLLAGANVFVFGLGVAVIEAFGSHGSLDVMAGSVVCVPAGTAIYALGVRREDGTRLGWWRGLVIALLPPVLVIGFLMVVAYCVTHGIGGQM